MPGAFVFRSSTLTGVSATAPLLINKEIRKRGARIVLLLPALLAGAFTRF
jgi:hypothetical protein